MLPCIWWFTQMYELPAHTALQLVLVPPLLMLL